MIESGGGFVMSFHLLTVRLKVAFVWFRLLDDCKSDIEIPMTRQGEPLEVTDRSCVDGPTQLDCLAGDAVSAAAVFEWTDAIARLRLLRGVARYGVFFSGYNPFHLLLMD